ncbi:MAG TPA: hypothetical protein VF720_15945 [Candidatus Eisenbacteria bacterium]
MMTSTFEFLAHPELGYVHIVVHGKMTAPDAASARGRMHTEYPRLNRLWDFRHADLTAWTADDMRMFNETIMMNEGATTKVRIAGLVARDVDFGVARLYESITKDSFPIEGAVFRDEAQAVAFVTNIAPAGPAD